MKNLILVVLFSLVSLVYFSQVPNFKTETTLENDGSISKLITVFKDPLMSYATLAAKVIGSDTSYFFHYRDQRYSHIVTYETTNYMTKDDVVKIFNSVKLIKDKVVDNAKCGEVTISKGILKSITISNGFGWGVLNVSMTESNFKYFIGETK
jgi:hypothetical protein